MSVGALLLPAGVCHAYKPVDEKYATAVTDARQRLEDLQTHADKQMKELEAKQHKEALALNADLDDQQQRWQDAYNKQLRENRINTKEHKEDLEARELKAKQEREDLRNKLQQEGDDLRASLEKARRETNNKNDA